MKKRDVRPTITIGNIPIKIVSDEEAEQANAVMCLLAEPTLMFPDNAISVYSGCGRNVQHRPNVPSKPPKLCMECAGMLYGQPKAAH